MQKDEILEKLRGIIKEEFGDEEFEINENTNLIEELKADSLACVELVMNVEDEFGIEIPNDEAMKFVTVGDIVKYIQEHTNN